MNIAPSEACPHGNRLASCPHRECSLERRRRQGPTPAELVIARERAEAEATLRRIAERPTTDAELVEAIVYRVRAYTHGRIELVPGPIKDGRPGSNVVVALSWAGHDALGMGETVNQALVNLERQIRAELVELES